MKHRRCNDPIGVPDSPNVIADPAKGAGRVAEFRKRLNYLDDSYRFEMDARLGCNDFNRSLARLRKSAGRPRNPAVAETRLHPGIELLINQKAKELAGLEPAESLRAEHAMFVKQAGEHVAKHVKAKRGAPGREALRQYVEGVMVALQEAAGKPVVPKRDTNSVYDPKVPGVFGRSLRILVDHIQPGVSDRTLYTWTSDMRKRHAGKSMRFQDLYPGYGMTIDQDGAPVMKPPFRLEAFIVTQPIYCP